MTEIVVLDFDKIPSEQLENVLDRGVRHKSGATHMDYLKSFLRSSRALGYATWDESWGEFEKEYTIIVRRLIEADRALAAYRALMGDLPKESDA